VLTIACVLKCGGDYGSEHVTRLQDSIFGHLNLTHRFVCLTDGDVGCEKIPLPHRWPGWWAKICLFQPGIFDGPVVYFDLDVLITGMLDPMVLGHNFTMLRSFWPNGNVNSSVLAWCADGLTQIYAQFAAKPEFWMDRYRYPDKWGDQDFIFDHAPVDPDYWQDKYPGAFRSYKLDVKKNGGKIPEGTKAVIFHGQPRPWNTEIGRRYASC